MYMVPVLFSVFQHKLEDANVLYLVHFIYLNAKKKKAHVPLDSQGGGRQIPGEMC